MLAISALFWFLVCRVQKKGAVLYCAVLRCTALYEHVLFRTWDFVFGRALWAFRRQKV